MKKEGEANNGWEPVLESPPSNFFVCEYGGPFAQEMALNRPAIERFLRIAALDGRVLLEEDKYRPPQSAPDLNSDGSITGKGSLRWGEKPQVQERKGSNYHQVEMDSNGWTININGGLIMEELVKRNNRGSREISPQFAKRFDHYLRKDLSISLLKDKFTLQGDPYLFRRIIISQAMISNWITFLMGNQDYLITLGVQFISMAMSNLTESSKLDSKERFNSSKRHSTPAYKSIGDVCNFSRRTNNHFIESLSIPFEVDRLVRGFGYLEWLRLKRQPLVRVAR